MRLFLALTCLMLPWFGHGQSTLVDSLLEASTGPSLEFNERKDIYQAIVDGYLGNDWPEDTTFVFALNQLAFHHWRESPTALDSIARLASEASERLGYRYGRADARFMIGFAQDLQGQFDEALESYFFALEEMKALNAGERIAVITEYIGIVHRLMGQFDDALAYYFEALEGYESVKDSTRMGNVNNSIGSVYYDTHDYEKAKFHYERALALKRKFGTRGSVANTLGNLSLIENALGNHQQALTQALEVLDIMKSLGNPDGIAVAQMSLGNIYEELGEYDLAIRYLEEGISYTRRTGQKEAISSDIRILARNKVKVGAYDEAEALLLEAEALAIETGAIQTLLEAYEIHIGLDSIRGNYQSALAYSNKRYSLRDSIVNGETVRGVARLESDYQNQKRIDSLAFAQQGERKAFETEIQQRRSLQGLTFLTLAVVIFGLAVIYRQYRKLQKANAELEKLNQAKTRFFSIISHDLRGPLTAFSGLKALIFNHLERKYSASEDEELHQYGEYLDKANQEVTSLMDDLLQWAVKEEGLMPYQPEVLNLSHCLEELRSTIASQAMAKSITLHVQTNGEQVYADKSSFMTILRNLSTNAIKFTPYGGEITFGAEANGEDTTVFVQDSGVGIPEDRLGTIFQLGNESTTKGTAGEKGTGLGLKLVADFVEMNQGKINVTSEEGKGSTFSIQFPNEKPSR